MMGLLALVVMAGCSSPPQKPTTVDKAPDDAARPAPATCNACSRQCKQQLSMCTASATKLIAFDDPRPSDSRTSRINRAVALCMKEGIKPELATCIANAKRSLDAWKCESIGVPASPTACNACRSKLPKHCAPVPGTGGSAGAPTPKPKPEQSSRLSSVMEGFARAMCACTTAPCAKDVFAGMMKWIREEFAGGKKKGSKADVALWKQHQSRFHQCYLDRLKAAKPTPKPASP